MANRLTGNEDLTPEFIAALMRGDFGDQTSMFADMRANPWVDARYGNPGNLSPDILAQIAAGTSPDYFVGHGGYSAPDNSGSTEAQMVPSWVIGQKLTDPNWGTARWQTWDLGGDYLGYGSADSDLRRLAKAVAVAAGAYYGAGAMSGGEAGAAGSGTAEGLSGMDLAADAPYGAGNNVMTAGEVFSGAAPGTTGLDSFRQGEINSYQTDGSLPSSPATTQGGAPPTSAPTTSAPTTSAPTTQGPPNSPTQNQQVPTKGIMDYFTSDGSVDWTKLAGGLLGAYAGYQSGKDREQTSKTEPWGPMQPYLLGLANGGADLYGQYKQQPFSPAEQTAYSNYGNVLDFINHAAPDLMSGFDANASGRNQFVRGQPRTLLGSNYTANGNPVAWQPGLLGGFGTGNNPRR